MKPKKSFGQHFLKDESIAERIADSLSNNGTYTNLLEVGPGKGMLTKYLLEKEFDLRVVEADRDMVSYLNDFYPQLHGRILSQDFLKSRLEQLFEGDSFALIGNFPYNISSQIVFKMLKYRERIPEMVGMFQKELAERIVAPPGSKTYGVISVLTQAYYKGSLLFNVERGSFVPPPKVRSSVIRLERIKDQELGCEYKSFRRIVKQAFSQRRKMLRNTMKTFIKGDELLNTPTFSLRPEQLSVKDYVELTIQIEERAVKTKTL